MLRCKIKKYISINGRSTEYLSYFCTPFILTMMKKHNIFSLKAYFLLWAVFSALFFLLVLIYSDHFTGDFLPLLLTSLFVWLAMLICGIAYKLYSEILQNRYILRYVHRQVESMLFIESFIHPKIPLPSTGDWAATADLIALVYKKHTRCKTKNHFGTGIGRFLNFLFHN